MKKLCLVFCLALLIIQMNCSKNHAPLIDSITVNPSIVYPSTSVTLSVDAGDEDGDAMTYTWSASYGSFSSTDLATVTWTAPSDTGNFTIYIIVSDEEGLADSGSVVIPVNPTWIETTNPYPVSIYDLTWTYSEIILSGAAGLTVDTVWLTVDITHTCTADLYILLRSPDGTEILFWNYDLPANGIETRYTTLFAGESINGTWTLWVYDNYLYDEGTLNSWTLKINW